MTRGTAGTTTSKPNYDDLSAGSTSGVETHGRGEPGAQAHQSASPSGPQTFSGADEAAFPGGYDPKKYASLSVDPAVKQLFAFIGRYQPSKQKLAAELKPFIPDYIAAIGDVDEFLKPARPDGKFELLGLEVLDEPSANQSDPAIMRKFLRANMKGTAAVEEHDDDCIHHSDADRDNKIDQWIKSVESLRETKAVGEVRLLGSSVATLLTLTLDASGLFIIACQACSRSCCHTRCHRKRRTALWCATCPLTASLSDTVQATCLLGSSFSPVQFKPEGRFPTMDSLMQAWPEELEPLVRNLRLPGGDVDMPTSSLAKALCALLDIPVYDDVVDSLHWMFTLFLEMKNNEVINPPEASVMAPPDKPNFVSFT